MEHPDAKKHQIVSFFKSAVRLLGYGFIPFDLTTATIILILSEIVGIVEELVWEKNVKVLIDVNMRIPLLIDKYLGKRLKDMNL